MWKGWRLNFKNIQTQFPKSRGRRHQLRIEKRGILWGWIPAFAGMTIELLRIDSL